MSIPPAPAVARTAAFVVGVAVVHALVALAAVALTRQSNGLAAIWPANAVVLAAMLARPRTAPWTAGAAYIASAIANILVGNSLPLSATFAMANIGECVVIALWLRRSGVGGLPRIGQPDHLVRFGEACVWAALISATLAASAMEITGVGIFGSAWISWFTSVLLGQLFVAPMLILAIQYRRSPDPRRNAGSLSEFAVTMALVAICAATIFAQHSYPLLFLIHPAVALATFRLRATGAVVATLIVALVASIGTGASIGPLALVHAGPEIKMLVLQLFLATVFITALPIASILEQRDIATRSAAEHARRYAQVVDTVGDVVFTCDIEGRWTFLNAAWAKITGHDPAESLGKSAIDYTVPEDRFGLLAGLKPVMEGDAPELRYECRYLHADGGLRWINLVVGPMFDDAGRIRGTAGLLTDISERRAIAAMTEEARQTAERIAATDELTGLASRRALLAELDRAMREADQYRLPLALGLIDIDHFKAINDTHGHATGDAVLKMMAEVTRKCLRGTDRIGRIGGEEFALVMPGATARQAQTVVERVRIAVEKARLPGMPMLVTTISIGIAMHDGKGDASALLQRADESLYRAKAGGRNRFDLAA